MVVLWHHFYGFAILFHSHQNANSQMQGMRELSWRKDVVEDNAVVVVDVFNQKCWVGKNNFAH